MMVVVVGWVAATPFTLRHPRVVQRVGFALIGPAQRRLRNETQLGFKQVKWIKGIEFVAHFSEFGGGYGGYNEDHEFFGYRQSI